MRSVRRSKLQLQPQQQNVKTSNTPVTVIDVKTLNMPLEISKRICFENKYLLFSIGKIQEIPDRTSLGQCVYGKTSVNIFFGGPKNFPF